MASVDFAAGSNVNDILMFGRYCQAMLAMEPGSIDGTKPLSPEEAAYISGTAAYDDSTVAMVCRERLDLGIDYYYAVKQQITSLLRAWDAVLDEKRRYDTVGWLERSRTFMDSFQLCSYLIPQRVSLGFFGPVRAPYLEPHSTIPALSPQPSYYSATSTIVNSPTDWADYESSMYDSGYGEGSPAVNDEYPESLAISPTVSNDSFEHGDFGGGGAGVVMISSDNGASESEYSYQSSDSDDSEQSEVPNLPNKFKSRSGPKAGSRDTGLYRPDGSKDARWESLLNDPPRARQPYQEEIQRDEDFGKRRPVSNKRKARSLDLEELAPRKKQALAGHRSGSHGSRDGTDDGSKRTRTRSRPCTV
jgi:hypothetical protein